MTPNLHRPVLLSLCLAGALTAQDPTVTERLDRLETENQRLRQRLDELQAQGAARDEGFQAMAAEIERLELRDVIPQVGESRYGFGPAASKVYSVEQGLSIGGYGEILFSQLSNRTDTFDAQRAILYFGYKFNDQFVFNSEIEIEHGTTGANTESGSSGSVSLEFAYIDYLHSDALSFRAGHLLLPMGLINELHEPTTFLTPERPLTEQRIIPTTWRAPGAGIFGEAGGFEYRAYGVAALDGDEFGASGLRGGRQKGNRASADDFAFTGRLDWVDTPGLLAGASVYWGDTSQDGFDDNGNPIPDLNTTVVDAHVDWRPGRWRIRGLYATAWIDDAGTFNAATGGGLARRMEGYYLEAGHDVAPLLFHDTTHQLIPYLRYEITDTQARMPAGTPADAAFDERVWTVGANWQPISEIVVKAAFQDRRRSGDRFDVLLGWIF